MPELRYVLDMAPGHVEAVLSEAEIMRCLCFDHSISLARNAMTVKPHSSLVVLVIRFPDCIDKASYARSEYEHAVDPSQSISVVPKPLSPGVSVKHEDVRRESMR